MSSCAVEDVMNCMKARAAALFLLEASCTMSSPPTTEADWPRGPAGIGAMPNCNFGYAALKIGGIQGPSIIIPACALPSASLVAIPPPRIEGDSVPLSLRLTRNCRAATLFALLMYPVACWNFGSVTAPPKLQIQGRM